MLKNFAALACYCCSKYFGQLQAVQRAMHDHYGCNVKQCVLMTLPGCQTLLSASGPAAPQQSVISKPCPLSRPLASPSCSLQHLSPFRSHKDTHKEPRIPCALRAHRNMHPRPYIRPSRGAEAWRRVMKKTDTDVVCRRNASAKVSRKHCYAFAPFWRLLYPQVRALIDELLAATEATFGVKFKSGAQDRCVSPSFHTHTVPHATIILQILLPNGENSGGR